MLTIKAIDDTDWFTCEGVARIMDQISDDMIVDGWDPDSMAWVFEHAKRYEVLGAQTPTWKERQAIWKAKQPTPPPTTLLNEEEMEYLKELLQGVNHPVGLNILEKLK